MDRKSSFAAFLVALFLVDAFILLDVPILRELTSFLFFSLIPGLLVLMILKLNHLEFIKKGVLSVGISIAIVMFGGLFLNSLYPFVKEPLSLFPVFIFYNMLMLFLGILAYYRSPNFTLASIINFKLENYDKLNSPLLFSIIFPLLAILGTYVMNIYQNNALLVLMLILIPFYLIIIIYLRNKLSSSTYPFSLWMISLALLLMHGLTSNYVMGRDVHNELIFFKFTLQNAHWDLYSYYNPYNACLSVNILPSIYSIISSMSEDYIFKLFYALLGSTIPLSLYMVSRKYLKDPYAFLAALLFVFQIFFVYMLGAVRQEIAILFFFLAVMILFSPEIKRNHQKILFLIFTFSLVVSHYTTAYAAYVLLLVILLYPFLSNLIFKRKIVGTNWDIILISFLFIIIWYALVAKVQYTAGADVVSTTMTMTTSGGNMSSFQANRGDMVLGVLGIVLKSVPNTISIIVHDLIFATILAGFLGIVLNLRDSIKKFGVPFLLAAAISMILMVLFVILPYISIAYDPARLFFQVLIFLSPLFILGAQTITKFIKKPKWDLALIVVLLIAIFSCATYLQYSALGLPYSPNYEKNGTVRGDLYIYPSELEGWEWINKNVPDRAQIYTSSREVNRISKVYEFNPSNQSFNTTFFQWNETVSGGYIYMGYVFVQQNQVMEVLQDIFIFNKEEFSHLFFNRSLIFDNGGSRVWF